MFATATENFVKVVDHDGFLIPTSSLNDGIALLSLVIKRKRFWFWQKPRYFPTDFSINDVLTGDTPIKPVIIETDFTEYSGTFQGNIQGNIEGSYGPAKLNADGKDTTKLQSSFGIVKKEEVDVSKLLRDMRNREVDMSHCLIRQTEKKHREVFALVKERIVTAQPCSVVEEAQQGGQLGGVMSLCAPRIKVSLKENCTLNKDSNVTLGIPLHTALAYGLIELQIKANGCLELCLMSGTSGCVEHDGLTQLPIVDASELDKLIRHYQLLSALPASSRASLLGHLKAAMEDREALRALEMALDHMMVLHTNPILEDVKVESHRQIVQAVLDILRLSGSSEQTAASPSTLESIDLVVSALEEMADDSLSAFRTCCSSEVLQALELLIQYAEQREEFPLSDPAMAPLKEEVFEATQLLFYTSGLTLKKDGGTLRVQRQQQSGNGPLVLCIAVKGLASLAQNV